MPHTKEEGPSAPSDSTRELVQVPSTTGQMGGKKSISTCKEHTTGDDDRLA